MKKLIVFTVVYFLLALFLISNFNNDIFITDQKGTAIIAFGVYVILLIVFYIIKSFIKLFRRK